LPPGALSWHFAREVLVTTGEVGVYMTSNVQLGIQDPVKVDPDHYRVELENDKVRILRVRYGPHEKSEMHRHPTSIEINLTVAHLLVAYPEGKTESIEARPSQVRLSPASERILENLSDFPYEAIAIELK